MPRYLRSLRGKMMLEPLHEVLGVREVVCPACRGSGWLQPQALERCPLCCGFREVPDLLSFWFQSRMRGGAAVQGPQIDEAGESASYARPASYRRYGRLAELSYRITVELEECEVD